MMKIFGRFKKKNKARFYFEGDAIKEVTRLSQIYGQAKTKYGTNGACLEKYNLFSYIEEILPITKKGKWNVSIGSTRPYIEEGWPDAK